MNGFIGLEALRQTALENKDIFIDVNDRLT